MPSAALSTRDFPTFDFLRGNEEYKMRWTQEARKTNVRRLIASNSAQLAVAEAAHRIENGLEAKLKSAFAGGFVRRAPRQSAAPVHSGSVRSVL